MSQAGAGTLRKRAAETINHREAEVIKDTVAERNHHRSHLNFLYCLSPHHRNFDGLSITHRKNKENWELGSENTEDRWFCPVFLNIYFLLFFFFFSFSKTAISNERFSFVCNKLCQLKVLYHILFWPQQNPRQVRLWPCSPELSTTLFWAFSTYVAFPFSSNFSQSHV